MLADDYIDHAHVPIEQAARRTSKSLEILGGEIQGALAPPVRFDFERRIHLVRGMPCQDILLGISIVEKLGGADALERSGITGRLFQFRIHIAVALPADQIVRHPKINIGGFIVAISRKIVAAVMAFADIGMSLIIVGDTLAGVEQFPVQSIQTDGIV